MISAICALGIGVVGVSIMVGIVRLEDALRRIGQGLVFIFLGLIAIHMVKVLLASVLIPALVSLKAVIVWLVAIAAALAALFAIAQWAAGKVQR